MAEAAPGDAVRRRKSRLLLVSLVLGLLIAGVALLLLPGVRSIDDAVHELARDLGIACIISALVTASYEVYIRRRFDLERLSSLLETVYGSSVPMSVWRRVTATVLARDWLRRNVVLSLRVVRDPAIGPDKVILDLAYRYELVNLTERTLEVPVGHALDDHIAVAGANLPRFVTVDTGSGLEHINASTGWRSANGQITLEGGRLDFTVSVPSGAAVPIRTRRYEVRECPGSYFLLMDELIDGLTIQLDEYLPDVRVLVTIRPTMENIDLNNNLAVRDTEPLLPGHGIELKFCKV